MIPYLNEIKMAMKVVGVAIGIIKKIDQATDPVVYVEVDEKVFTPGTGPIDKFLNSKFIYMAGTYHVKYGGESKVIVTRYVDGQYPHWEFRLQNEDRWWNLPQHTIESIDWVEVLEYDAGAL